MRTVLLSGVVAASLVVGCAASSPTAAPPSASAPPASSAPVTEAPAPTPEPTPAPTVPAATPTPGPTPSDPVAAAESIAAVLAELPRLKGQRIKSDVECMPTADLWGVPGAVALCTSQALRLRTWERQVQISVLRFTDAERARAYFKSMNEVWPVLDAPDIGEISELTRASRLTCGYDIRTLEGKTITSFEFGGIGKASAGRYECRSWGSPPIAYAKRAYSMISNALGTP